MTGKAASKNKIILDPIVKNPKDINNTIKGDLL